VKVKEVAVAEEVVAAEPITIVEPVAEVAVAEEVVAVEPKTKVEPVAVEAVAAVACRRGRCTGYRATDCYWCNFLNRRKKHI
jgi:hypothetical protein